MPPNWLEELIGEIIRFQDPYQDDTRDWLVGAFRREKSQLDGLTWVSLALWVFQPESGRSFICITADSKPETLSAMHQVSLTHAIKASTHSSTSGSGQFPL